MSILRKYLIENLRKTYKNVSYTYGYEIKSKRIANRLAKDHNVDPVAFPEIFRQSRTEYIYIKSKVP